MNAHDKVREQGISEVMQYGGHETINENNNTVKVYASPAIWRPWEQRLQTIENESKCFRKRRSGGCQGRRYISVIFAVKEWGEGQGSSRWRTPTKASWWDGRVPKREYAPSEFNGKQISSYFSLILPEIQNWKEDMHFLQSILCWLSSQLIWMQLDKADISDNSYSGPKKEEVIKGKVQKKKIEEKN